MCGECHSSGKHQHPEEVRFPELRLRGEERVGGHFPPSSIQQPLHSCGDSGAAQQRLATSASLSNLNAPPRRLPIGPLELDGQPGYAIPALNPWLPYASLSSRGSPPLSERLVAHAPADRGCAQGQRGPSSRGDSPPRAPFSLLSAAAAAASSRPSGERSPIVSLRGEGAELPRLGPWGSPRCRTVRAQLSWELGEVL